MKPRALAFALAMAAILGSCASIERSPQGYRAAGRILATNWPYFAGSVVPVRIDGFPAPFRVALSGAGSLSSDGIYHVPEDVTAGTATLVAGNAKGLAARTLRVADSPSSAHAFLAVASYDDGIVFHSARDFSVLRARNRRTPSDVAIDGRGRLAATDTQGSSITIASLAPWSRVAR